MASAAKSVALVFMLLLAAVVAAHGHKVSCKNNSPVPIKVNGIAIGVNLAVNVDISADIVIEVGDKYGKANKGSCKVPADVTALVFVAVKAGIQVKVAGVSILLGGLLHTVLGLVLMVVKCILY